MHIFILHDDDKATKIMITKVELGGDDDLFNFRPCKDDIEASKLNSMHIKSTMNSKKHDLYELIR